MVHTGPLPRINQFLLRIIFKETTVSLRLHVFSLRTNGNSVSIERNISLLICFYRQPPWTGGQQVLLLTDKFWVRFSTLPQGIIFFHSRIGSFSALCELWLAQSILLFFCNCNNTFPIFMLLRSPLPSSKHSIFGLPLGLFAIGFQFVLLFRSQMSFLTTCPSHVNILGLISLKIFFCFIKIFNSVFLFYSPQTIRLLNWSKKCLILLFKN